MRSDTGCSTAAHGVELTDDGRHFLAHAYLIESAVADAQNMPRLAEADGDMLLAAMSTLVGYFLPEHIHRLSTLQPELQTQTLIESRQRLWLTTGHTLAHPAQVILADVAEEPLM